MSVGEDACLATFRGHGVSVMSRGLPVDEYTRDPSAMQHRTTSKKKEAHPGWVYSLGCVLSAPTSSSAAPGFSAFPQKMSA